MSLKRICDEEEDFDIKAQDMIKRFKDKGYKNNVIKAYIKAKNFSRDELLVQRQKTSHSENSVYFVTQYSTEAIKIKKIVKTNWEILMSNPHLREVLPESPAIVFIEKHQLLNW